MIIIIIGNLRLLSLGSSISLFPCTLEDNHVHWKIIMSIVCMHLIMCISRHHILNRLRMINEVHMHVCTVLVGQ